MRSVFANVKPHYIYIHEKNDFYFESHTPKYFYTFVSLRATYFYQAFFLPRVSFFRYIIEAFAVIYPLSAIFLNAS